ncbi:UNVERIFIED_CONTAM: Sodium/calcium exchanger 1, partial [Gekko kuhli]
KVGSGNGGAWLKVLGASFAEENDEKQPLTSKEEEERRIAEMGRPILGEHTKLEVIIEESYEFKNTVDKLIKKTNLALVVGTNSWREQFIEAITVSAVQPLKLQLKGRDWSERSKEYATHIFLLKIFLLVSTY